MGESQSRKAVRQPAGIPGRWYVSFPGELRPEDPVPHGPFDTEQEARDWVAWVLHTQSAHRGWIAAFDRAWLWVDG